jgi:prepilin-type N-terminal cleavage/methylation domain-containing protein
MCKHIVNPNCNHTTPDMRSRFISPRPIRRRFSAFTLIELLIVIVIIAILAAVAFPVYGMVMETVRKTEAEKDVQDLKQAISSYQLEYGRFPYGGDQDVELNTEDDEIMSILAGVEGNPLNKRGKVFYQGKRAKKAREGMPVGGTYGEGNTIGMADPWGQPYYMIIDANYDNKVENPDPSGSGEIELRQQVVVWSKGKPRQKGSENEAKDWHTSW